MKMKQKTKTKTTKKLRKLTKMLIELDHWQQEQQVYRKKEQKAYCECIKREDREYCDHKEREEGKYCDHQEKQQQ